MPDTPTVTIIGAGALGAAMAARLGETGHPVRLWNRTAERARSAAEGTDGVTAVDDLVDAVAGSPVVFTVLRDGCPKPLTGFHADPVCGDWLRCPVLRLSGVWPRRLRPG